jgi:hypothetical protein
MEALKEPRDCDEQTCDGDLLYQTFNTRIRFCGLGSRRQRVSNPLESGYLNKMGTLMVNISNLVDQIPIQKDTKV